MTLASFTPPLTDHHQYSIRGASVPIPVTRRCILFRQPHTPPNTIAYTHSRLAMPIPQPPSKTTQYILAPSSIRILLSRLRRPNVRHPVYAKPHGNYSFNSQATKTEFTSKPHHAPPRHQRDSDSLCLFFDISPCIS